MKIVFNVKYIYASLAQLVRATDIPILQEDINDKGHLK